MIVVQIGELERSRAEANAGWINQQIRRRRRDGTAICVRVRVDCPPGISIVLSTPACGGMAGGRPPNATERRILKLWKERGLIEPDFTGGDLVAFLRQLESLIGSC